MKIVEILKLLFQIHILHTGPPHLIKTTRNNLMNLNKRIWNKSYFSWNVIQNLIEDDLALDDLHFFLI